MDIMVLLVATESERDQLQDCRRGNFKRALSPERSKARHNQPPLSGTYWLSTVAQRTQWSVHSNRNHLEKNLCVKEGADSALAREELEPS